MSKEIDELKKLLREHKKPTRHTEPAKKIAAFNEKQNNIKNCSERTVYQLDIHEKSLIEFVSKFTPVPQQWKLKFLHEQEKQTSEALTFIVKYIKTFLDTYRYIATDLDTNTIKSNKVLLEGTTRKRTDPHTMIWRLIQQMPVIIRKKMSDKTTMAFRDCEKLVKDYIDCKTKNKEDVSLKGKSKSFFEKENLKDAGLVAAGFVAENVGSFIGHFFKSSSVGNLAQKVGGGIVGGVAAKIYSQRKQHHDIKATFDKLNSEVEKAKFSKDIKSKFGGGGSYKALRSSTVMVGDNPGGRESINIGNQAFKTNGPSLLKIKAGQSIHANPLSGMGKTRINPKDFDALGGGTEEPITATTNTDRITDALDKNTEVLELIYKEQHDKFREDKKLSRKKTLGEHVGGFIDSPDKKAYIKNIVSKSSLGNKSIGEHVGGFLDAKDKKGYIKNIIKDKTLGNMFGTEEAGGIAGGIGEAGGIASTAMKAEKATSLLTEMAELAGAGAILPTLATGAVVAGGAGALGYGGYKMATGHNAGAVPESMKSSMGGYNPSYSSTPEQLANAIKKTESGGNYGIKGASGEHGAYQYMPGTWNKYSSEYAKGTGMTGKVEMTPANQDAVTQFKIKQWKAQGLSDQDIAAKWNSGSEKNWQNKIGVNSKGVPYNTPAYVNKVMGNVQSVSPTAMNPVPVTPKKLAEKQLEVAKAQSDLNTKAKTDAQAKKDAIAKAASKTTMNVGDNTKNVDRESSSKGTIVLSSGDSSLLTTFNAQWGRS
jgi:hypothetical protein